MTNLSVNINKIATLRNARGSNVPNLLKVALDIEKFGANGITVHPRPDERHIRYQDVLDLSKILTTEFNIEGYPNHKFIELVLKVKPAQVTLVPDPPGILTSNEGWKVRENDSFLTPIIKTFKDAGIRVSLFLEPDEKRVCEAKEVGADRIEFYTGHYAHNYHEKDKAIVSYIKAANKAIELNIEINAGHDLNLENLTFFANKMPMLHEVSIGHALVSDALYFGLESTVKQYLACIKKSNS